MASWMVQVDPVRSHFQPYFVHIINLSHSSLSKVVRYSDRELARYQRDTYLDVTIPA